MSERPGGATFSDFPKRLFVAAIGIPAVVAILWLLPPTVGVVAMALLAAGGAWELARLLPGTPPARVTIIELLAASMPVLVGGLVGEVALLPTAVLLALALLAGWVLRGLATGEDASLVARSLLALSWIGLPLAVMMVLFAGPSGRALISLLLATVWIGDTAAYAVGKAVGRHHIVPEVSPKKTWEGTLAGIATSTLLLLAVGTWFPWDAVDRAILGALIGAAAFLGDIVESKFKRMAGVKDSGTFFGGHGGILDRLDAVLFAAPVLFLFLRAIAVA
jgi:phosphatidate cytidylyltransferase